MSAGRNIPWWWPLYCAVANGWGRVEWLLFGAPEGVAWEVVSTPDGRLETQALTYSGRLRQRAHPGVWVHGDDREDVMRQAHALFPDEDHDFLWNTDAVHEHLCVRYPVESA